MTTRNTRPDAAAALAKRAESGPDRRAAVLAEDIRKMESQFRMAMPRGAEASQLIRDALTCLRNTPKLSQCERSTVLGGLMTCAQLGLRPGVGALGHAWLLPFWDSRERIHRAQLVIGYQGYVELGYRSGRLLSIAARTVHVNDVYEIEYRADGDHMVHRPALDGPRGEPRLYYARAQIRDGGYAITDPMSVAEMEAHRDRHAKARDRHGKVVGPWVDHFDAMAHKTMILRLAKLLPKSTELATAIAADEGVRVDLSPDVDPAEVTDVIKGEAGDEPEPADQPGDAGLSPQEIEEHVTALNEEAKR